MRIFPDAALPSDYVSDFLIDYGFLLFGLVLVAISVTVVLIIVLGKRKRK